MPHLVQRQPGSACFTEAMGAAPIGVIGGGIAGVTAARTLSARGVRVRLYERAPMLGGRLGSVGIGDLVVGTGASYIKAQDPLFQAELKRWEASGAASVWHVGVPHAIREAGVFTPLPDRKPPKERWYVGTPCMNSLVELEVGDAAKVHLCKEEVTSLKWRQGSWILNERDEFSTIIAALPVAQLKSLIPHDVLKNMIPALSMEADYTKARYSVAFVFPHSLSLPFKIAFPTASPIALILNDSSRCRIRLGSNPEREVWVAQTSTDWTARRIKENASEAEIASELLQEFRRIIARPLPQAEDSKAVLWKYGNMDYKLEDGHAWDPERRLGLAGDWCYNGRVEGAWLSGYHCGRRVLESLPPAPE